MPLAGYAPDQLRHARHVRQGRCAADGLGQHRCLAAQHLLVALRYGAKLSLGFGAFLGVLCKALSLSAEKLSAV